MSKFVTCALLFLLLLPPQRCFGFAREHHGSISRTSFELLARDGVVVDSAYQQAFIKGSMHEDNTGQLVNKWFHQHFYRNGWNAACGMSTCVHWFEHLGRALARAIERKDHLRAWSLAGMMAHYLQDMNCPPHVVPIYHLSKDRFDQEALPDTVQLDHRQLAEWSGTDPRALLDELSLKTYRSIDEPLEVSVDGKQQQLDWSLFWCTDPAKHHSTFGQYGAAGNAWGQEVFHCVPHGGRSGNTCQDTTTEYRVSRDAYHKYRSMRVDTACTATAALIQYVNNGLASNTAD